MLTREHAGKGATGGKRLRDIVIVLPGITGSVLQQDGKDLWALSGQAAWNALRSLGKDMEALRIEDDDPDRDSLDDDIVATRVMPDAHLVPGLVRIDGYSETIRMIQENFQVVVGSLTDTHPANFFEFPYDWRRDNRVSARRLQALIRRQLPLWREASGAHDARVVLLAHSMGGLVSRYYLEVLEGWRDCKALITFGTPYRGSLNALGFLANGFKKLFMDLTEVLRSLTSVYQLLPIYPVVDVGGHFMRVADIDGLPHVERKRAVQALGFHREIEQAVERHSDDGEYLKRGYKVLPVVGVRQPTYQSGEFLEGRLELKRTLPDGVDELLADGDGTVPRLSAIPLEMSNDYRDTFVPERHGSLQANHHVLADIVSRLEQMQVQGMEKIRGPMVSAQTPSALSVDVDDLYAPGELVTIRAQLLGASSDVGTPTATFQRVDGQATPRIADRFEPAGDSWQLRTDALPAGLYRLVVATSKAGPGSPPPVREIFEVADQHA
ncbi:MAG: esterase/lipase family protein [Verrucomicrobiia bacterium]